MEAANFKGADNSPIQTISAIFIIPLITVDFGKLAVVYISRHLVSASKGGVQGQNSVWTCEQF
jgi:hypothetical protein